MDNLKDDVLLVLLRWRDKFYGEDVKENDAGAIKAVVELTTKDQEIARLKDTIQDNICIYCYEGETQKLRNEVAELKQKLSVTETELEFIRTLADECHNSIVNRTDEFSSCALNSKQLLEKIGQALKTIRGIT